MGKSTRGIVIIIAVVVPAIILAVALTGGKSEAPSVDNAEQTNATQTEQDSAEANTTATATDAQKVSVEIKDHAYNPSNLTVKVGTTVTWTNQDSVRHDVQAKNPSADAPSSELLAKGESYSFTFNKAGTYDYFCTPHPFMQGKVTVTE